MAASFLFGLVLIAGCGGGGGGGGSAPPPPPPTVSVAGNVQDSFTSMGAPNVTVTIQGQANPTTTTDANGNYTLTGVPENSNVTLVFTNVHTCETENFQVTTQTSNLTNQNPPAAPFILPEPVCAG